MNYKNLRPTERFSSRVENYIRYRPSYPKSIVNFFEERLGLSSEKRIADIGSGTGLFAKPFLENDYTVLCVEPNDEMRNAAEKELIKYKGFISIKATAENTSLESNTIDLVVVAQAFHWMNPDSTKKEFSRILKKDGRIAILWILLRKTTPFLKGYEEIRKEYGIDYKAIDRANENEIAKFYEPKSTNLDVLLHNQSVDFESLKGHLLSASFIPLSDHPRFNDMILKLEELFETYQKDGKVEMQYETIIFWN